jgi:hypothetical protein
MQNLRDSLFVLVGRQDRLHQNSGHRVPRRVQRGRNLLLFGRRPMLAVHSRLNMRGGRRDEHLHQNGEHRV